jgi:hypothetical protein
MELLLPFRIHGAEGSVRVVHGRNEDPRRWGYHLLDFDIDAARGFPVVEATVEFALEGYAANMGWLQLVRYRVAERGDETVIVDVAPQLRESKMPFLSFGLRPTMFDAPATTDPHVTWRAASFLTYAPDCLMTPTIRPACGFRWGYDVRDGSPEPTELLVAGRDDWLDLRTELEPRYPDWTFLGD